jgi:hypothetical protein
MKLRYLTVLFAILVCQQNTYSQSCISLDRFYSGFQYDTTIIRPAFFPEELIDIEANIEWVNYYHKIGQSDSSIQYIHKWINKTNNSNFLLLNYQLNILLGERLQYIGKWDSAKTLFESLVPLCENKDTLLLYVNMNLLKLKSKLQLENYEWMKMEVARVWAIAIDLNEERVLSDIMQMAVSYNVTDAATIEEIEFSVPAYNGRKNFHLANNYKREKRLALLNKAQKLVSHCDPLYRFKLNALLAYIQIKAGDYDLALVTLHQNDAYIKVLNDLEVSRHQYQLFQTCYHYQGKGAQAQFYEKKISEIEAVQQDLKRKDELKDLISNELTKSNNILHKTNNILIISLIVTSFLLIIIILLIWSTVKTQRSLKATNRQLHQLFQVVSHDIQSPLSTAISISNDKNTSSKELQNELLDIREKTNSILTWASQNLEGIEPQKQSVHLNQLIQTEIDYFDTTLTQKQLLIQVLGEVRILTDPNLFAIVIRNGLDNAIKYAPEKTQIEIQLNKNKLEIKNKINPSISCGTQKGYILIENIAKELNIKAESIQQNNSYLLRLTFL